MQFPFVCPGRWQLEHDFPHLGAFSSYSIPLCFNFVSSFLALLILVWRNSMSPVRSSFLFKKPVSRVACSKYSTAGLLVVWFATGVSTEIVEEFSAYVVVFFGSHSISFKSVFFCAYESLQGKEKNTSKSETSTYFVESIVVKPQASKSSANCWRFSPLEIEPSQRETSFSSILCSKDRKLSVNVSESGEITCTNSTNGGKTDQRNLNCQTCNQSKNTEHSDCEGFV